MTQKRRSLILWMLALSFYFVPAIIAGTRKTENDGAIFLVNLLVGWTVFGWIGGLLWALRDTRRQRLTRKRSH